MRYFPLIIFGLMISQFAWSAQSDEDDFTYKIPSSLTVSASGSDSDSSSTGLALRLFMPKNYWVDLAMDRAVEKTDDLETNTLGGSMTIGTDPLDEYSLDIGFDAFGVEDQYRVQEVRIRGATMPGSFESILEIRGSRFSFANSPNIIFQNREVILEARTLRLEFGWYGWTPVSLRVWTEQSQVASGFSDLARPLAPVFIPVTAISTALSWPGEEYGLAASYAQRRFGTRLALSTKRAIISGDRTATIALFGDYKWTRKISTGLRISQVSILGESTGSSDSTPILSAGADLTYSF